MARKKATGGTMNRKLSRSWGVKGLKTIIPFAGIASWYDYTNSQGISILNQSNYADYLASNNAGGTFLDNDWDKPNPVYGSWLWTIATEQEKTNGDYAPVWEQMDYTTDEENHIACSALVVNGMNDINVTTRHAELMVEAFQKAGKTVKLVLHQGGHMTLTGYSINGTAWDELMNMWLSHYLYGVENGAELHVMLDSDRQDLDGLMISAILMDVSDQGAFPVFAPTEEEGGAVTTKELNRQYLFDNSSDLGLLNLIDFDQIQKAKHIISQAWTDLQNPGCGKDSSEYTYQDPGLISGIEQEYTFYFLPMVYTVAEGHHLELILTTWDPYRVKLDAWFNLDGSLEAYLDADTYTYNMTINNESLELILPTGIGNPDWLDQPEA